jgi:hypothetical protein
VHHKRINQTKSRVIESGGDRPDSLKTEASPRIDAALIGADHKIELHGEEAKCGCSPQRVLAHDWAAAAAVRGDQRRQSAALVDG